MRFKTDENVPPQVALFLRSAGHDAATTWDQKMRGVADGTIAEVCRTESRVLITLDLDFAEVRTFPPEAYPGIIVLRPNRQDRAAVTRLIQQAMSALDEKTVRNHLCVDSEGVIRIHGDSSEAY